MYRLGDVLSRTITAAPPPPSTGGTYELEKLLDSIQVLILWYMTLLHFVAPQLLATPLSLETMRISPLSQQDHCSASHVLITPLPQVL